MERYYPEKMRIHTIKEAHIWCRKSDYQNNEEKEHIILTRRQYSFLYIDDIRDIGKKKERVIRGTVLDIKEIPKYNVRTINPSYMTPGVSSHQYHKHLPTDEYDVETTSIIVDASDKYDSHIEELKVSNILDINDIDYKYETKEDTKLVPGYDKGLTFVEKEKFDKLEPKTDPRVVTGERYM